MAFDSDNEFGIQTLLPELQGMAEDAALPFARRGSIFRLNVNRGAWHFYTDDCMSSGV